MDLADKLVSRVYSERVSVSLLNFNGDADSVEGGEKERAAGGLADGERKRDKEKK